MEFGYTFQPNMDMNMNTTGLNLEFDGGNDDREDVLYTEIRRQILLLTADDDDDEDFAGTKHPAAKRSSNSTSCFPSALQPGSYFNWWENENTNSVPVWLVNLWRNGGNGTGVFIPQISNSRRYYKPGRMNNERRRTYKPVENKCS